jgi:hypothetical protein
MKAAFIVIKAYSIQNLTIFYIDRPGSDICHTQGRSKRDTCIWLVCISKSKKNIQMQRPVCQFRSVLLFRSTFSKTNLAHVQSIHDTISLAQDSNGEFS